MSRRRWTEKQTQVVLADLEAWVQQLYEDHRVRIRGEVSLPTPQDGIRHGVCLEAYRVLPRGKQEVVHRDWVTIESTTSGAIEKALLQMASRLLLDLESDKERAERQTALPF
jgi:hypothetical protein